MDFTNTLIHWYSIHKRDLPWRQTNNPYYIWLSEIILQQTQVKQGLPYYQRFVQKYPTIFDLADASEKAVLKLWQGLGYYSRARNLHTTAQYIAFDLSGKFPNNYEDLLALKGVGDYTASAIASIAFNEVTAVVDGNVYRVLSRYFGIHTPINSSAGIKAFKILATDLIDQSNPAMFNQAIMEFGAIQCKPKKPNCTICLLSDSCTALQKDIVTKLPIKLRKIKVTKKYFNFLVFISEDQNTIFQKRQSKGIWAHLYQFPLIESDRSLEAEEFYLLDSSNTPLIETVDDYYLYNTKDIIHKLSHQHLYTKFWIISVKQIPEPHVPIVNLKNYPVPALIGDFLEAFSFSNN